MNTVSVKRVVGDVAHGKESGADCPRRGRGLPARRDDGELRGAWLTLGAGGLGAGARARQPTHFGFALRADGAGRKIAVGALDRG